MASLFHLGFYAFFYVWNVPENFVIRDGTEVKLHDPSEQTYLIIFSAAVVFAIGDSVTTLILYSFSFFAFISLLLVCFYYYFFTFLVNIF
jgi:hypothetical protein